MAPSLEEFDNLRRELDENKRIYQLVMGNIPQFIFWKESDSVYLGCNQNLATVAGVGYSKNIIAKMDYDLA